LTGKQNSESGFDYAVRIIRRMIECELPDTPDRARLLRHMNSMNHPITPDSEAQAISFQLLTMRTKAAKMRRALQRCEPWNDEWKAPL
jgi:hypothetical protein